MRDKKLQVVQRICNTPVIGGICPPDIDVKVYCGIDVTTTSEGLLVKVSKIEKIDVSVFGDWPEDADIDAMRLEICEAIKRHAGKWQPNPGGEE